MRRAGWLFGIVFCLWLGFTPRCEASRFSDGIDAVWKYVVSPVNCLGDYGSKLVTSTVDFVRCVLHNINPERLVP